MSVKLLVRGVALVLMAGPVLAGAEPSPVATRPATHPAAVAATARAVAATPARGAAGDSVQVRVLLVPPREAKLSSQMAGRVINLPAAEGASFSRGALLVEFDCEHEQAQLAISNAALAKARSLLSSKTELQKHAAVGDLEVQLAAVDVEDALARQKQALAAVRDCRVTAPYGGRVVKRNVNQFENVGVGTPLLEIQETGRLKLEALLPSHVLAWIRKGAQFTVHVDELNRDVTATITGIGSRIDSVSQTIRITAEVSDKAGGLLPGMSGSATLRKP